MAMGETSEMARKSFAAMCQDMDDDGNTSIEIEEWTSFYEKSLKDAVLSDVLEQFTKMKNGIEKYQNSKASAAQAAMINPSGQPQPELPVSNGWLSGDFQSAT